MSTFLFSVDVEDARDGVPGGERLPARVPEMVDLYLDFLRRHRSRGTFFVVGQVARRHPDLIRTIIDEGHEIGCHSDRHIPLDRLDRAGFRSDTLRNLDALHAAGAIDVAGYRAPCFSLNGRTQWAHEVLAELGFNYSSSVLPARNPLYGWPGFGHRPRRVESGLWEIPVTLLPSPLPPLPMGGGVYFRALPKWLLRRALAARRKTGLPLVGYFHPYDVDSKQERFAHAGFRRLGPYNWLMYRNREQVIDRLEMAVGLGFELAPLGSLAERLRLEGTGRDG